MIGGGESDRWAPKFPNFRGLIMTPNNFKVEFCHENFESLKKNLTKIYLFFRILLEKYSSVVEC